LTRRNGEFHFKGLPQAIAGVAVRNIAGVI
jgi:hypothetical protein